MRTTLDARVARGLREQCRDRRRRAVVDEHHLVDVAQRLGVVTAATSVRAVHGDHRGQPPDRRGRGAPDGGRAARVRRSARASGTRATSAERPHPEQRAVGPGGGDQQPAAGSAAVEAIARAEKNAPA